MCCNTGHQSPPPPPQGVFHIEVLTLAAFFPLLPTITFN